MDVVLWLLALAYTINDWYTTRTWWMPWVFAAFTVVYLVWFYVRICQSTAAAYYERLLARLHFDTTPETTEGELQSSNVIAECLLSRTGGVLLVALAQPSSGPEAEPGAVEYSREAQSLLRAFVKAKRASDDVELDAQTIAWLRFRWLQPTTYRDVWGLVWHGANR